MPVSRRNVLKTFAWGVPLVALKPSLALSQKEEVVQRIPSIDEGPFVGTRVSLRKYEIPEWFRDAKFGIWAHWGPQSAIEYGDWYARNMYIQGHKQYDFHLKTFGHPSRFGFKDTIPAWKAEKFDADFLMGLYKKAGAKYFMTMGVHHDNFDLWNSKHNRWNAVNMGPHKDIVGMWKKAAQKHGLKFAISDHLWISHKWFSTSKGSDANGQYKNIFYDGVNPDTIDFYGNCDEVFNKHLDWNENNIPESWKRHWFDRIKDLIDNYQPDLLYCDGQLPFEDHGLNIVAHLYNVSAAKNHGKTEAVYTSKRPEDSAEGSGVCVYDVERGVVEGIWPLAWQTDTCIGDWHYNKERVGKYKSTKTVIDLLVDIVSRNGNLMLNFPLPASGMLDKYELEVLAGITKWMAVNNEGIYATRPWKTFGESVQSTMAANGKNANATQAFNESKRKSYTNEDIRFTTKGNILYAFMMGWPENEKQVIIRSLASNSPFNTGTIQAVELVGVGKLDFMLDAEGLKITLPDQKPGEHAFAFKISGNGIV